jgi:DNA-binding NarL/FixJ family response regulator
VAATDPRSGLQRAFGKQDYTYAESARGKRWEMVERTRVLVADDNGTYGVLLSRFVSSQPDMEVIGLATDGAQAVSLATLLRPDLVLMDLCMPGIDGFEATRMLTATYGSGKVIAMTAHHSTDVECRVREAGAVAFLRKDEVDAKLLDLIRELTAGGGEVTPPGPDGGWAPA